MRLTVLFFALACGSASCQSFSDAIGADVDNALNRTVAPDNVRQSAAAPQAVTVTIVQSAQTCSIPLLNARAQAAPAPMPNPAAGIKAPVDRMPVAPPVPACTMIAGVWRAPVPPVAIQPAAPSAVPAPQTPPPDVLPAKPPAAPSNKQ